MQHNADRMDPVVRQIISGRSGYSAVDAFEADYKLRDLRRAADAEWQRMDVLAAPHHRHHLHARSRQPEPIRLNTNLGYYTNFVNLLDLAAVARACRFPRQRAALRHFSHWARILR